MTSTPSPASRRQTQLRVCRVPHGLSLTALACALLAGCAAPVSAPVDNSLPAGWVQQPQAAAGKPQPMTEADLRDWWRRFDDAELNALVDEALANSHTLAQAVASLRQQRFVSGAADASYLPEFSAGARTLQDVSATDSYFHASIDMLWDLGLFGAREAHKRSAEAQLLSAQAQLQAARVALVAEVVHRYLDIRLAQQQRALLAEVATLDVRQMRLAQVRREQRIDGLETVQQLQLQAGTVANQQAQLKAAQAKAAHGLAALLGRSLPDAAWLQAPAGQPAATLPQLPESLELSLLPADLLRVRPDIQQAEAEVEQAAAEVGIAQSALYPRLVLGGSLLYAYNITRNARSRSDGQPVLGPVIDVPLFDWGRRRAQVHADEQQLQARIHAYRQTVLDSVAEVESSLAALNAQGERLQALAQSRQSLDTRLLQQQRRQQLGLDSEYGALADQRLLLLARGDLAVAQAARALAYVSLYKALGGAPLPARQAEDPAS